MRIGTIVAGKGDRVATIAPEATIADAVQRLADEGVGALVVSTDGARIDGIISERDIVRSLGRGQTGALALRVDDLMTSEVVTCSPSDTVDTLMAIMTDKRIRHVPMIEDDRLAGIVSIGDVVKWRLHELEEEAQHLKDYITGR